MKLITYKPTATEIEAGYMASRLNRTHIAPRHANGFAHRRGVQAHKDRIAASLDDINPAHRAYRELRGRSLPQWQNEPPDRGITDGQVVTIFVVAAALLFIACRSI